MLLFIDGTNHYDASGAAQKWGSATFSVSATSGRYGNKAISGTGTKAVPAASTYIFGAAYKIGTFNFDTLLAFRASNINQIDIRVNHAGILYMTRNGTTIATATNPLALNTYYYLELKVFVNSSTGYAILRVNENVEINFSGNTQAAGSAIIDNIRVLSTFGGYLNDIYICDTTGSYNNDFLGDVRIETIYPTADSTPLAWTPSTGSTHYNLVNETSEDGDTTYVTTSGVGIDDVYSFSNLVTTSGTVLGIQQVAYDRKTEAGGVSLQHLLKLSGTVYAGVMFSEQDTYTYHLGILETNPDTAAEWSLTDINNAEFGIRRI